MMVKDFDTGENKDRYNKDEERSDKQTDSRENISGKRNEKGPVEVKNANASGDGSYGRNESNIPEEERPRFGKDDSIY
jgi:hypothetical protein